MAYSRGVMIAFYIFFIEKPPDGLRLGCDSEAAIPGVVLSSLAIRNLLIRFEVGFELDSAPVLN